MHMHVYTHVSVYAKLINNAFEPARVTLHRH